jgi:hypothetical protein
MRKAVYVSILLALVAAVAAAQDNDADIEAHFGWQGDAQEESEEEDAPADIHEAKRLHRSYRIGGDGVHRVGADDVHVVAKGDTLWDVSQHYFDSPWHWPELWSFNPEITNPHWIYPLDQLRLSPEALVRDEVVAKAAATGGFHEKGSTPGILAGTEYAPNVVVPRELMKPGAIFLRDQGYLDRDALRTIGQVVGANEEHMLLSSSDQVYVKFRSDEEVKAGQAYSMFRPIHKWERNEEEQGHLVRILGTVVIRSYDRDKRVARGVVTETLEPIERGIFVAKVDRRFDLIPPKRNEANVTARIVASVLPTRLIGFNQVVFLDVGQGHGIQPGNRFFVVRRGDTWYSTLKATPLEQGNIVDVPPYDENELPKEVVAELRVLKVRKNSTIALITRSDTDIRIGDLAEMRVGF